MGKNNSKLKKKNRTQSMSWNFRFPSLTSLSMKKKNINGNTPHMSIRQWLNILNLGQYESLFEKFKGIEDVMKYTENDLKDLGVKNEAHCCQMASSLLAVKVKYEKISNSNSNSKNKSQRHSVAVDPTLLVNKEATESDILTLKKYNQSKSLSDIKMETVSQDFDSDVIKLKKVLEWELSLDTRDLRSHAWYHGAIPRTRAEEIVDEQDGDFLVRDCTSQPGNYVLSCHSKGQNLHFVINKIVLHPDTVYETVQYRFEEDSFDTVPDLITFYVGSGKPITAKSGAKIQHPRNRLYPLSFYAHKYKVQNNESKVESPVMSSAVNVARPQICSVSPTGSPSRSRKDIYRTVNKKQRSLSLLSGDTNGVSQIIEGISKNNIGMCSSSNSLPRRSSMSKIRPTNTIIPKNKFRSQSADRSNGIHYDIVIATKKFVPTGATAMASRNRSQSVERNGHFEYDTVPPPKPYRLRSVCEQSSLYDDPSQTQYRKNSFYIPSGSDSGNGSGDSMQSCNASDSVDCVTPVSIVHRRPSTGVIITNPKYFCSMSNSSSTTTLKAIPYDPGAEDMYFCTPSTDVCYPTIFDLDTFHTLLLPTSENKPLDATALQGIHMLLLESGSRILANHLTRVDLEFTVHNLRYNDVEYMCKTGIELFALPHGHQHRLDLIERTECLKLFVAVTILACSTESERAEILNKWIEVAIDTKTALGNLYGFSSIMLGLCTPQVQRLSETWHILRQKYTDSAFNFEAKLRPTLKSMNEATNPLAPNTTIPHILPAVLLYEQTYEDISGDKQKETSSLVSSCISPWETTMQDLGLATLFSHLDAVRNFYNSLATFRRNAEIVLGDSKVDDLLIDMFRTEFHLKFLWGSRGATVSRSERYLKFEQVLDVMSQKCESVMNSSLESDVRLSCSTKV